MSDLLNDARAEGAAEERTNAAKSALVASMTEEDEAEMASLQPAMHTVLVDALKKRERTLQKRTQDSLKEIPLQESRPLETAQALPLPETNSKVNALHDVLTMPALAGTSPTIRRIVRQREVTRSARLQRNHSASDGRFLAPVLTQDALPAGLRLTGKMVKMR